MPNEQNLQRLSQANLKASVFTSQIIKNRSKVPTQQELLGHWGCTIVSGMNLLSIQRAYPRNQMISFVKQGDNNVFEESEAFSLVQNDLGWIFVSQQQPDDVSSTCMLMVRKDTKQNNLLLSWNCLEDAKEAAFRPYGVEDDRVRVVEYGICKSLDEKSL